VIDVRGRRVRRTDVGTLGPGVHATTLATGLPVGVYLVRLSQTGKTVTRKVSVLR
jgi:hypothetical protein